MKQVLGHDALRKRFGDLMSRGKLHHAWLLYGPAGIGKRMLAHALAADYLCEANRDSEVVKEACGICHGCRMMAVGSHPDFMLIEREINEKTGKLNRDVGVDQVRDMLGFLSLSGAESARRVALMGESQRMNGNAANAMLKNLEEPSPGTLLLLVCEDALSLPATVRSRCMLEALSPLPDESMKSILHGMNIEPQAIEFAMKLADGQPGKVAVMSDPEIASALLAWHDLLERPEVMDIGHIQQWISKHVQSVPHDLIVDVVLAAIRPLTMGGQSMPHVDTLLDAAHQLAAWPQELIRRTLRPAPTLLAHMLALRLALRELSGPIVGRAA